MYTLSHGWGSDYSCEKSWMCFDEGKIRKHMKHYIKVATRGCERDTLPVP